jgi:hypothetical protein
VRKRATISHKEYGKTEPVIFLPNDIKELAERRTRSQLRCSASSDKHVHTLGIFDSVSQAPSAELCRLYLVSGKMLDDPRRFLEVPRRLHSEMADNYIGDNYLGHRQRARS